MNIKCPICHTNQTDFMRSFVKDKIKIATKLEPYHYIDIMKKKITYRIKCLNKSCDGSKSRIHFRPDADNKSPFKCMGFRDDYEPVVKA